MTPNLMKAELISASPKLKMDSINHSNALYGHSNEDSSKKKKWNFLVFSPQSGNRTSFFFAKPLKQLVNRKY